MQVINYADSEHVFYIDHPEPGSKGNSTITVTDRLNGPLSEYELPLDTDHFRCAFVICVMASVARTVRVKLDDLVAFDDDDIRATVSHAIDAQYLAVSEPCYHEKHGEMSHRCVIPDESDLPSDMVLDWSFPTDRTVVITPTEHALNRVRALLTDVAFANAPTRNGQRVTN